MLILEDADLHVAGRLLLQDANFKISRGDRIGIIGRNGSGKSHLMGVLAGDTNLDGGVRLVDSDASIILVKQQLPDDDQSPMDYLRSCDKDLVRLNELTNDETIGDKIGDIYDEINRIEEERYEVLAPSVLMGLGLSKEQLEQPMRHLSGGLRMRISLAQALIYQPDILLLDEPTNHLDLESTQWLIRFLNSYPNNSAFVVVTHDVMLLNEVTTTTVHLRGGVLTQFSGNYRLYLEQLAMEDEKAHQRNTDIDKQVRRQKEIYYKFRGVASRAAQAKDQLRKAKKLEGQKIEIVPEEPVIDISFGEVAALNSPVIKLTDVNVGYPNAVILNSLNLDIRHGDKIGLVGRNGQGKTSLMRILAGRLNPVSGIVDREGRLKIAYFSQELSDELNGQCTVYQQFSASAGISSDSSIRDSLGRYGFSGDSIMTMVNDLSGGEKSRLMFAIICSRSPNMLILDEPTNHLDVETREVLVDAINSFTGTVILVSHDLDLHEKTMHQYWLVDSGCVNVFKGGIKSYQKHLHALSRELGGDHAVSSSSASSASSTATASALPKVSVASNSVFKPGQSAKSPANQSGGRKYMR